MLAIFFHIQSKALNPKKNLKNTALSSLLIRNDYNIVFDDNKSHITTLWISLAYFIGACTKILCKLINNTLHICEQTK